MNGIQDPAWFYSSLAQVSAAIVGLIGGLLVSRLVDHGATLRTQRRDLVASITAVRDGIEASLAAWGAIDKELAEDIKQAEARKAREHEGAILAIQIGTGGGTWPRRGLAGSRADEACTAEVVLKYGPVARIELRQAIDALSFPIVGRLAVLRLDATDTSLRLMADSLANADDRVALLKHAGAVRELAARLRAIELAGIPKSLVFVVLLLLWLSATGIIWPLSVLPGLDHTTKSQMLASLALGLMALAVYVGHELLASRRIGIVDWRES